MKISIRKSLQEKAKSRSQQRFMGMVRNCQKTGDCASSKVEKTADSMNPDDTEDFAKTKLAGLPDKVETAENLIDEIVNMIMERY